MAGYPHTEAQTKNAFWAKVVKTDGCWLWIGAKTTTGYGCFRRGTLHGACAHRFAYEWAKGSIADGLEIDHLCRNRGCVNPDHLEAVSHRENMRRGETVAARNGSKTHCHMGHIFNDPNTMINVRGQRVCRMCANSRQRKYKRRAGLGVAC